MPAENLPLKRTPPQELLRLAEHEPAGQADTIARFRRMLAASNEPSFSGDLRRATDAEQVHPGRLADECGVDWQTLEDFRAGSGALSGDVINRLVQRLGMKVMMISSQRDEGG